MARHQQALLQVNRTSMIWTFQMISMWTWMRTTMMKKRNWKCSNNSTNNSSRNILINLNRALSSNNSKSSKSLITTMKTGMKMMVKKSMTTIWKSMNSSLLRITNSKILAMASRNKITSTYKMMTTMRNLSTKRIIHKMMIWRVNKRKMMKISTWTTLTMMT